MLDVRIAAAAWMSLMAIHAAHAQDLGKRLTPSSPVYTVPMGLSGAKDVSGMACRPEKDGQRRCLLVNDENPGAQFVTLTDKTIVAGPDIDIVGQAPSSATLGTAPREHSCSDGKGKFGELDGEGVAYAAPYFYVVGSHGCSRQSNKFKLSSFVLARIRVDDANAPTGKEAVETTYRLADALRGADEVGDYFAADLESKVDGKRTKGLNVEGVAVIGARLYAGLRAPTDKGTAYIVEVDVDRLFAPGHATPEMTTRTLAIDAEAHTGIRDLAVMPDGKRLLVLMGPAQDQEDVPYSLLVFDPDTKARTPVGKLADLSKRDEDGKAEAVVVLDPGRALVLFDSLRNGGAREYRLD